MISYSPQDVPIWPNYNIADTRCHVNFYSFKNTSPHNVLQQSSYGLISAIYIFNRLKKM